jgi:hypothetical protein
MPAHEALGAAPPDQGAEHEGRGGSMLSALSNEMVALYKTQLGRGPTKVGSHWAGTDALIVTLEDSLRTSSSSSQNARRSGACARFRTRSCRARSGRKTGGPSDPTRTAFLSPWIPAPDGRPYVHPALHLVELSAVLTQRRTSPRRCSISIAPAGAYFREDGETVGLVGGVHRCGSEWYATSITQRREHALPLPELQGAGRASGRQSRCGRLRHSHEP